MSEFTSSVVLQCSAAALRSYLGRPQHLPLITDPELELEIIRAPDVASPGTVIEFRVTAFGFKQRATHEYVETAELRLVEKQIDGPMRAWVHSQTIEPVGESQCRLTDLVVYERPGGMLGFVLTEDRVRESLETGMNHKYQVLQEQIDSGAIK